MRLQSAGPKPRCPFCGELQFCRHLIGWTENGKTVQLRHGGADEPIKETDRIIKTGISARVYRPD